LEIKNTLIFSFQFAFYTKWFVSFLNVFINLLERRKEGGEEFFFLLLVVDGRRDDG
jgi:hypothetical protein